jgi:hypothetical protein
MRRIHTGTFFFLFLLSALTPLGFSQLRNLSQFTRDRVRQDQTYFILHDNGTAEYVWSSEWTHTTAYAYEGKSAIFVWHFKDGTKAYSQQGKGVGEIGKNSGYFLTDKSAELEDIHGKKFQPMTLGNYPVKVELWIGEISDSKGYSPEVLGDEVCIQAPGIEYNISYRSTDCPHD